MRIEQEKKEVGSWWIWILFLLVISGVVLTGLSYMGFIGQTVVERVVFENSFQYSEARKSEIATYEAQLTEIERKLLNHELDQGTRINLEAQASGLRVQLSTAKAKQ
jgi:flagellar basal body-associated protein FliL